MVVMLLKRCHDRLEGSEIPAAAFTKITHLELSQLDVSLQQAVKLSTRDLIMLDMSHSTNVDVPAHFGQEHRLNELRRLHLSNGTS